MNSQLRFEGHGKRPSDRHDDAPRTREPYVAPPPLVEVVNLAIHLGRPLLLEGEAGCGKTKLARAVAYELGLPFYPWYVNSGTRVAEGLYTCDTIGRLHDVQMRNLGAATARDPNDISRYIEFGALGKAFQLTTHRAVVLIDEIDKASVDFANDLLSTLDDDYKFTITETGREVSPNKDCLPIIFITSNREKGDLPEPFLRRCLYHFMEFPDADALKKIVGAHYKGDPAEKKPAAKLVDRAVARFDTVRKQTRNKKPGTSEFLDWLDALHSFPDAPHSHEELIDDRRVPYPETLFKLKQDRDDHLKLPATTTKNG